MARRLTKGGHQCVVFDRNRENVNALAKEGPAPAYSLEELVEKAHRSARCLGDAPVRCAY